MHEQVARVLYYFGVHLLYASMVWVAAWALTSVGRGSSTSRYWIWVATALNFLLPVGALVDRLFAPHLAWARPLGFIGGVGLEIAENATAGSTLAVVWLVGAGLMAARLWVRLRRESREQRAGARRPGFHAHGVPVKFGQNCAAPAVDGIWRPQISLPEGIHGLLSDDELDAVLIHEATHARRRDNLIRLVYEAGLCVLWFHPLVWITRWRLALYRELSCDESVIRSSRGVELVTALAKLANPEESFLLQARASSFLSERLARLAAPPRLGGAASVALSVMFGAALAGGVWGTVAHTACCFVIRRHLP